MVTTIVEILGKEGLRKGKLMAQQAIMLNRVEEELPSASDIAEADNIGL